MATYNLAITSDADDGHEEGGTDWLDREAEGYPVGEFFSVLQTNNAASDRLGALRFQSTGIQQGETISSATLTITLTAAESADPTDAVLLVTGDDVDDSPALSDTHRPSSGWNDTTATATANNLAIGEVEVDVTAIVQEIVNRPGFSGGAISFKLGFSGSDTYWDINVADYDADTLATVATLDVITEEVGGQEATGGGSFDLDVAITQVGAGQVANRKLLLTEAQGLELRDENRSPVANLSGIRFEWYDKITDTQGNPDVAGTFDTNGNGEAVIPLPGTGLSATDEGTLILEHPTDDEVRGIYRLPVS